MRRFFKYILQALAVGVVTAILVLVVLLIPAVQKTVLTRALSGPDTEVAIDSVRIRPGSAVLSGIEITTTDARVAAESLDSRFRLRPLLFQRTLHVDSLTVSNVVIDLDEPDDPPEPEPWETYPGLLLDLPVDFLVAQADIDGLLRMPAGPAITFSITGSDLSSRDDQGRIAIALEVEDENLPGDGILFADIDVFPEFGTDGVFQQLRTNFALREREGADPLLFSELWATRTETGERYGIEVRSPGGPDPDHLLLAVDGEWERSTGGAEGTLDINIERELLPINAMMEGLPGFSVNALTRFAYSEGSGLQLTNETLVRLSEIAEQFGMPRELDEILVDASFDLTLLPEHISLRTLDIGIASGDGIDLARVHAPGTLDLDFTGDEDWQLPDEEEPILLVAFPGIPPELINLLIDNLSLTSNPITGKFALYSRNNRYEIETSEPLSFENVTLADADGIVLLEESRLSLRPSGFVSAMDFNFQLAADASIPQVRSFSLALESSGALPLADTNSTIRIHADGFPAEVPISELTLTGTAGTSHENGNAMPDAVTLDAATEVSLRPQAPAHLPSRVALTGELAGTSRGYPYTLALVIPDPNGSEPAPAVSVEGFADVDWSRTEGIIRLHLPEWWAEIFSGTNENLQSLSASGEISYEGTLTPFALGMDASTEMTVDTGRTELPGNGKVSLTTESGWRLHDFLEVDSFELSVGVEGGAPVLRADLRQPLAFANGEALFDILPQGELLGIELNNFRLDEWIPEEQRGDFSGGDVRGGFLVTLEGEELHLRPGHGALEISEIGVGSFEGQELRPLTVTMTPFARLNPAVVTFGIEELFINTNGTRLLAGSLAGEMPLDTEDDESGWINGTVSVSGDLAYVEHLLGENFLPNLQSAGFALHSEFVVNPSPFSATWSGSLTLPEVRANSDDAPFAINAEFSGETDETRNRALLAAEVRHGDSLQDFELTAHLRNDAGSELPSLELRGSSEFLDLIHLQDLAGIFSRGQDRETEPEAPVPETLFPMTVDGEFDVARIRVMPDFEVSDLRVRLTGDDRRIDLREARVRLPEEADIEITGALSLNGEILQLVSAGSGNNLVVQNLLRRTLGVEDPDIEGTFAFGYDISSRASGFDRLIGELDGVLTLTGERGRLRFRIPDGRMERVRRITGMQEGAIGSLIARLAGAPPGVQALAESLNLLTDVPYQSIDVRLAMAEGRTLVVERMELAGPFLYAAGTGSIEGIDLNAIEDSRLNLRVELGTEGSLRQQFRILNLLSEQRNPQNYQMLRQRPISITGTIGDPNLRDLWDLLIQAGAGAATARDVPSDDERRRDPVEDAVRGIRDVFGW